jgi:hypothetical protein
MKNTIVKGLIITLGFIALFLNNANAQIGIGTITPDASAALDIKASGSAVGLLLPRLTTAERDANIKSPSAGLVIYNSTTKVLEVAISGSLWVNIVNGTTTAVASGATSSTGKIGIGTNTPNANAVLDVSSTTKGVLLPQAATDPTGVEGMIYYNTTSDIVKLYNGTSWITLTN